MNISITRTRFRNLGVRSYCDVTRINVPGHARPFRDTWHRYVDLSTDQDIGPSFKTRNEALAYLHNYAADHGYEAVE